MQQIIAGVAAYAVVSVIVTVRLAYLIGQHRGMHARKGVEFLRLNGSSMSCRHTYCDDIDIPTLYFLSLFLFPVLFLLVIIVKVVRFVQRVGFNSVQLPENSHPGIEVMEVRLKKPFNYRAFLSIVLLLLSLATVATHFYFRTNR